MLPIPTGPFLSFPPPQHPDKACSQAKSYRDVPSSLALSGGPGSGSVCGAGGSGVHSKGNKILFPFGWVPGLFVSRALSLLGLSGQGWRIWRARGVGWAVFVVFADFSPLPVIP